MKTKEIFIRQTNFFEKFNDSKLSVNDLFIIRGGDRELPGEQDPGDDPPTFPEEG
ncbi:MAG: hypothetical protein GH151_13025 [Bacteroidetes bacterium]|nr:hypothetical protein [Bacteroidota bacterium]